MNVGDGRNNSEETNAFDKRYILEICHWVELDERLWILNWEKSEVWTSFKIKSEQEVDEKLVFFWIASDLVTGVL